MLSKKTNGKQPNADIIITPNNSLESQIMIESMISDFEFAIQKNGLVYGDVIYGKNWEFVLELPRNGKGYPVVKHAKNIEVKINMIRIIFLKQFT